MKKTISIWVIIGVFVVFFCSNSLSVYPQAEIDFAAMEEFLKTAEIVSAWPDENAGRTEPWDVELDDGKVKRRAMFKHRRQCRPHPRPDCYKYELAAYELSKLLNLPVVPPTVERLIKGIPGSLQLMLVGCKPLDSIEENPIQGLDQEKFYKNMLDILVFENLVFYSTGGDDFNEDIFVRPEDSWIWRVDFGQSFSPRSELILEREVLHCSTKLSEHLQNLSEGEIREKLKGLLNDQELDALIKRKELIQDIIQPI